MQPAKSPDHAALWKLLAYFAVVFVGAAVLAPLLFWAGKETAAWVAHSSLQSNGVCRWLADALARADFNRYFNRAVMLVAITAIWPLIRFGGFDRGLLPVWRPLGSGLRQMLVGLTTAAVLLLLLGAAFTAADAYRLRPDAPWLGLGGPLGTALTVAVLEEFLFRGILLGLLLRSMSQARAMLWGMFIFAIVHFLKPPEALRLTDEEVGWLSGFRMVGLLFSGFSSVDYLIAEFLTLCAVGWVLGQARLVTGRLWLSIGLHAGWVFGLKYFSALTRSSKALRDGDLLPWIGLNLKIGLTPLFVVLFTGWLVLRLTRDRIHLQPGEGRET